MPERTLMMPSLPNSLDVWNTLNDGHLDLDIRHLWPDGEGHQG